MHSIPRLILPVWQKVDVLVVGGTCAAVAAALAARRLGRSVAVLASETYLGEDLAGTYHLWPEGQDPLLTAAFNSCEESPARPAALKRYLEQQLIRAGIPFLFGARPIGLLSGPSGNFHGAVFAARTSLFSTLSAQIVDASAFGLIARLAQLEITPRINSTPVGWRVLCATEPNGWTGEKREITPPYRQVFKGEEKTFRAFELGASRSELGDDPKSFEHEMRARLVDETVWGFADHLVDFGESQLSSPRMAQNMGELSGGELRAKPGLWIANRLLPVADSSQLANPFFSTQLGRIAGAAAAAESAKREEEPLTLQTGGMGVSGLRFTEAFLRSSKDSISLEAPAFPTWNDFDVIVAGGGTGGAPAAIAAARSGARTLCIESAYGLGGVGTIGLISSYWFGNKCGFTAELTDLLEAEDSVSRAKKGNAWHPGVKSAIYHRLLRDAGGTTWLGSMVCGILREGDRPTGVLISTLHGCGVVPAKTFVDATGNADLAAAAGAPCRLIERHHVAVQGTGLSPRVYPSVGYQNSDHTFIEENDPEGLTAAHVQAREKYPNDFETTPFVNSRERRQILGELEISPLDILAERTFPDTIFTARSNFDTHGFIIHPVFMVAPPDHKPLEAHVPLRCMLPKGLEGVLVTGLGMSAHRDALPVIRMQADVQNQGYAAGMLAAQCAASGQRFREVEVRAFQKRLVAQGIITAETAQQEDSFPLSPTAVDEAIRSSLTNVKDVAIIFAHPEQARSGLIEVMKADGARRDQAALILGLMGEHAAAAHLEALLTNADWDEGWNYRGMGQFGASMSRIDALIIALGRCGHAPAAQPLIRLVGHLDGDAAFSHCRALALATASLGNPELTKALAALLDLPGICGHAHYTMDALLTDTDADPTSTHARNRSLRELYLARGVFLAGDPGHRGRAILEAYSKDLRGHFARHAAAVLSQSPESALSGLEIA